MANYLQKRRRRWYAIMEIPARLRPVLGKPRFLQSLGTDSYREAQRLVVPVLALWRAEIARARGEPDDDTALATVLRRTLANAKSEQQRAAILHSIEMAAWDIGAASVDQVGQQASSSPEAQRFHAMASGALVATTEHLDEYLATLKNERKSIDMKRSTIKSFAGSFPALRDIQRRDVQRWINDRVAEGKAASTVQRMLSELRGYWSYLRSIEAVSDDAVPFAELSISRPSVESGRKDFTSREVVKLWREAKDRGDDTLADLIWLDMWTGCRIEEICALKVEHVAKDCASFEVVSGKTEAAKRTIPIHSKLKPAMRRLVKASSDGYVLSGLTANKYGDRSALIGKKFGRLKTELGHGPDQVFHSIRRGIATQLDNASVPEQHAAAILGHTVPGMSFGTYSGGPSLVVKREAIEKLSYPLGT